jgi:hypothetical protein
METMAFSYLRDAASGLERTLWNCKFYPAVPSARCMKRQTLTVTPPAPVASPTPQPSPSPTASGELNGVRRSSSGGSEIKPLPPLQ